MSLFEDWGGLLKDVFDPFYPDAVLRKTATTDDGSGTLTETYEEFDIKAQRDEFSDLYRTQANIPSSDAKFIMLTSCDVEPAIGDVILHCGLSWRVVRIVSRDPLAASIVMQCTPNG